MKKKMIQYLLVIGITTSLLAGCGSSASSKGSYPTEEAAMDMAAMEDDGGFSSYSAMDYEEGDYGTEMENRSAGTEVDSKVAEESAKAQAKRKLITTVDISAETIDFANTISSIESWTVQMGGYIESSSINTNSGYYYNDKYIDLHKANYTIRIPEENLEQFLSNVKGNTNVTSTSRNVEDVTLKYADITAHKSALEAERDSLKKLMDQATNMEDIMAIQTQLTDVQYQIDSIESQIRTYDNRISYSTVYLDIKEKKPSDLTIVKELTTWERITKGFADNLEDVGDFFMELIIWFLTSIPTLIFLAVFIFIVVLIVKKIGKTRKTKKDKKDKQSKASVNTVNEENSVAQPYIDSQGAFSNQKPEKNKEE